MFLLVSVILFTGGGGSASVHAGILYPPGSTSPWEASPQVTPLGSTHTPGCIHPGRLTPPWEAHPGRHPLGSTPPGSMHPVRSTHPLGSMHPPGSMYPPWEACTPREADSGIRSMSGRYASYWNAFLFEFCSCLFGDKLLILDLLQYMFFAIHRSHTSHQFSGSGLKFLQRKE